jgi:mediator of RNA polymerase II transcription subunit 17
VSILTSGAERLRKSQEQAVKRTTPNFHYELLKLRNKWRLKKVGNTILGDLSFKSGKFHDDFSLCRKVISIFFLSAGSRFWQSGTFEVTKNDLMPSDFKESSGHPNAMRSPLQVHIPTELESVAYIQVSIRDTQGWFNNVAGANKILC